MTRRLFPLGILLAACLAGCNGTVHPNTVWPGVGAAGTAAAGTGTPAAGAQANTTVLASANGLSLTRDDAEAFIDAFQFALGEAGRPETFTAAEREQLIQGLAQNFAKQPAAAQQEMAKARATWTVTQAAWATKGRAEKQEFVEGVLTLAVGEQGAAQLTDGAAAGGGAGGGAAGGDPWAAEAKEKCENGSYEDQMFYCHGVQTPTVSPW